MISLTCTSCQKVLEIDDAFAGGVCRCQYCGTIQTVPARLKGNAKGGPAGATGAKTLYQKKPRAPGQPGTGLEDLAESIVGSSGLVRGALKTNRAARPEPPPPKRRNLLPVFIGISVILLIVVTVLTLMLLHR